MNAYSLPLFVSYEDAKKYCEEWIEKHGISLNLKETTLFYSFFWCFKYDKKEKSGFCCIDAKTSEIKEDKKMFFDALKKKELEKPTKYYTVKEDLILIDENAIKEVAKEKIGGVITNLILVGMPFWVFKYVSEDNKEFNFKINAYTKEKMFPSFEKKEKNEKEELIEAINSLDNPKEWINYFSNLFNYTKSFFTLDVVILLLFILLLLLVLML